MLQLYRIVQFDWYLSYVDLPEPGMQKTHNKLNVSILH